MKRMHPQGVDTRLSTMEGPHDYEIFTSLGLSLSTFSLNFESELNTPVSQVLTIGVVSPVAAVLLDGIIILMDSSALTYSQVVNGDGSITYTFTYNPSVIEEMSGALSILLRSRYLPFITLPITVKSTGIGTLSCTETVNFPTTEVGTVSTATLTLTNSSTVAPLVLTSFELNSTVGLDYVINPAAFPLFLEPLQSYDLEILFVPNANSLRSASLKFLAIDKYVPNVEIALIGIGASAGVSEPLPIVVFDGVDVSLPESSSDLIGKGIYYQVLENTSSKIFVVTDYTFSAVGYTLMYPELIVGTVFSVGEIVSIPIRYDLVTATDFPEVTLSGFYI